MATTPGGLPYPVGTDKVVDGDDAIKNLAVAQENFNKLFYSPIGTLAAVPGVDTGLVAITLPTGVWELWFTATTEWVITGTVRYLFSVYLGAALSTQYQLSIPTTAGTVPVAIHTAMTVSTATAYVQVMVRQTGVVTGQANVNTAQLMAKRVLYTAA